jgi:hypothetical protein
MTRTRHIIAAASLLLSSCAFGTTSRRLRSELRDGGRPAPIEKRETEKQDRAPHRWDDADRLLMLPPESTRYESIAGRVSARAVAIEEPCADDRGQPALARVFDKLAQLELGGQGNVRILHLGDSHIAADYISGTARRWLQYRFGDAGRGFVAIDQRLEYGGRRLERQGWKRTRVIDPERPNSVFGFSGMSLESLRKGARVDFQLTPEDAEVVIYHLARPAGTRVKVLVDEKLVARLELDAELEMSWAVKVDVAQALDQPKRARIFSLVADGPGAVIFGLSFEAKKAGVIYAAVGPVGADARSYLSLDRASFQEQLRAVSPDLTVLMVGGNDALMVRNGKRTLDQVREDHENLIHSIRSAIPDADCMIWSPMDSGELVQGQIASKRFVSEVRDIQRSVATKLGCGFWDMYESMGARGSFERWYRNGMMNDDLVHPRALAGELIGHLFATALVKSYGGPFARNRATHSTPDRCALKVTAW